MHRITDIRPSALAFALLAFAAAPLAQDPPKGPDKEVATKLETLKECVADRKLARDEEGIKTIDELLQKSKAGNVDPKDQAAIVKGFEGVFTGGKLRPPDSMRIYGAAAQALGYCGADGAKVLKAMYQNKRFPEKKEWVPLREQLLKSLGHTKDESMVKFLVAEARRNPEAALQAAAGEALGNYEEAKDAVRKGIVDELLVTYGELAELASQMGSANVAAQNAQDRLAALKDKWNTALAKLTRQNFATFSEWQKWFNKNKNVPW